MTRTLTDILSPSALTNFADTHHRIRGLPPAAYTEQPFLALENERLFPNTWTFVGFAHELVAAGDIVPIKVGCQPMFLIRTRNGELKAFHNVCSHRCTRLVEEIGNVGRFLKCPYHAWVYDLDGGLRGTPHFGGPHKPFPEGFDPKDYALREVRCTVWCDWIFVNINNNAPDFEDYAAPLIARLNGVDFGKMKPIASLDFGEVSTNWKFLMENFIEPYHVQFVHSSTTDQPLLDHYTIVDDVCLGSAVDISHESEPSEQNTLGVTSRFLTLFPNFVFGLYLPNQIGVHLNVPVASDKTHQRRVLYDYGDQDLSSEAIDGLKSLWGKIHKEDHHICERLQAGRHSDVAADGGVLSPHWENALRHFQELVIDAIR